jgi:hypothetical protein
VVGRGLWFYTMKHTLTKTLKALHKPKWTILEAPSRLEWFTSDDPVICLNYRSESGYDFKGGWNRRQANILFPLSRPSVCSLKSVQILIVEARYIVRRRAVDAKVDVPISNHSFRAIGITD